MLSHLRVLRGGRLVTTACFLLAGARVATAQQRDTVMPAAARPVAHAALRTGPIAIDGRLDDAAWSAAPVIANFTQRQPDDGATPSQRTEVRILYDNEAVYIGARMFDDQGARGVRAPLARRDQLLDGNGNNGSFNSLTTDKFAVAFDPYHNHIDEAWFEINPVGTRGDQFNGDPSWDPIWEGAAHVDSLGWTAEMRIPYSQLRFSRDTVQHWGMQLWRYADRLNERDMWSFRHRSEPAGPAFFGTLEDIRVTERPRQVELLPYVVSRGQFKYAAPDDPYHRSTSAHASAGGELKLLLTSNLTLDATVNPDFGQVEVDPATINLSAYETYYDEKRPFFIAGSSAFDFGGMNCMFCSNTSGLNAFYSRRIGRPPQLNGWVDGVARYDDTPDNTAILGAAKVTGRTAGGVTVGLLDAVTNRETAVYRLNATGPQLTQAVEPYTNYFVGRAKKDFNAGNTMVGTVLTSVARQLGDSVLGDRLRSRAEAGGMDWVHYWHKQEFSWMGSMLVSDVGGSPSAMALTERSSAHYFQRPDRRVSSDGLFGTRYDTTATALRGYGFYTRVAKESGDWLFETAQNWRSPGFEVNDLSYLDRADYKWMNANLARQWVTPTSWYRNIVIIGGGQQQFNYDGDRTDLQAQAFAAIQLPSYWNVRLMAIHHPTTLDDRLTRGGPVERRTGYDMSQVEVSTDARQTAVYDIAVTGTRGIDANAHRFTVRPGVAVKPAANVFLSLSPTFDADENVQQYVERVPDPTAAFGNRYVFAYLKSRTVSLDTRVNWTFTPALTLQLYAQPFIASGAYSAFREFAGTRTVQKLVYGTDIGTVAYAPGTPSAPGTYTIDPDGSGPATAFSFANPDFTVRSFIGNAVLRWEYRPGSTVYFVWTQQRTGYDDVGDFDFATQRAALFRDRPTNIFQVKLNYWVGR